MSARAGEYQSKGHSLHVAGLLFWLLPASTSSNLRD